MISGRQLPPELTVNDLVIAVTESPKEAPVLSQYDCLDLLINGDKALIRDQVYRYIYSPGGLIC